MNDMLHTMLILFLISALTIAVSLLLIAIRAWIVKRDDETIEHLARQNRRLTNRNTELAAKVANLTNEIVTLRGNNLTLNAENDALEAENRQLLKGTPAIKIKGRISK